MTRGGTPSEEELFLEDVDRHSRLIVGFRADDNTKKLKNTLMAERKEIFQTMTGAKLVGRFIPRGKGGRAAEWHGSACGSLDAWMRVHGHPVVVQSHVRVLVTSVSMRAAEPGTCSPWRSGMPHLHGAEGPDACTCRWWKSEIKISHWTPGFPWTSPAKRSTNH